MPNPGELIGPYELIRKLGAGAFGEVWLSRHVALGVERALKVPTDPDYVAQLRREGQLQFRFDHPNIVKTFELNPLNDPPYAVMEYVEGESLRERLNREGKLPQDEALRILCQLLEAVQAAHTAGVLHRDLKPENILLAADGAVKVTDFGISKVQAHLAQSLVLSNTLITRTGASISGTLEYMSLGQRRGAPACAGDDLYAVAVVACELLTGRRPSPLGVTKMLEREGVSEGVAAALEAAFDEPHRGYADAEAMRTALERVMPHTGMLTHTASLTRENPSCFVFLIDQSRSMAWPMQGPAAGAKKHEVARILNDHLRELVLMCQPRNVVENYLHIGVIGYGCGVRSALRGALAGRDLVPVRELERNPAGRMMVNAPGNDLEVMRPRPFWVRPVAEGRTPMCQALSEARRVVSGFLCQHPNCFPPVVINLTDGAATDGDPTQAMREIKALSSTDGNVILFNCHITSAASGEQIAFPNSPQGLPNDYARRMFDGASELPAVMRRLAREELDHKCAPGARAFTLNADARLILDALRIGTLSMKPGH